MEMSAMEFRILGKENSFPFYVVDAVAKDFQAKLFDTD